MEGTKLYIKYGYKQLNMGNDYTQIAERTWRIVGFIVQLQEL